SYHLNRTYGYSPASDVTSVGINDALSDLSVTTTMTVTPNGLHRIASAAIPSGLPYSANVTYWPSGSINTASVQLPSGSPQPSRPSGTTFQYNTTSPADVQAVTGLKAGSTTLSSFLYDATGNLTHRDVSGLTNGTITDFAYDPNGQARQASNANG